MPHVCASHMSQITMAVRATGHSKTCSETPASLLRRRARRRSVPGTFGRFGKASRRGSWAASSITPGIDTRKDLLSTSFIRADSLVNASIHPARHFHESSAPGSNSHHAGSHAIGKRRADREDPKTATQCDGIAQLPGWHGNNLKPVQVAVV